MSIKNVSTRVLDKNKEHYSRCKDKAKKSYDVLRHIQLHMSKYKKLKIKINSPLCETYNPTVIQKSIFKKWTNIQEASG